jgi:hypothetical protein
MSQATKRPEGAPEKRTRKPNAYAQLVKAFRKRPELDGDPIAQLALEALGLSPEIRAAVEELGRHRPMAGVRSVLYSAWAKARREGPTKTTRPTTAQKAGPSES